MNTVTKFQFAQALFSGGPLQTPKGSFRIVNSVEREDGSGRSFNITGISAGGSKFTVHVTTID